MLVTALIAPVASAGVKVEVQPDGRKVFTNDGSPATRRAPSLGRPLPLASVQPMVDTYAERYDLDPRLVHAVIRAESGYNPHARSGKGAMGLMQLMPATAEDLRVADPYDPASNIAGGTQYLRALLDRFDGNLEWALAGYNAGPEAVRRFGGVPPFVETRQYLERVLREYRGDPGYQVPAAAVRSGRPVRLVRDASGRPILTTSTGG
jgi:soluble lytic murein transglycosylase-like protein